MTEWHEQIGTQSQKPAELDTTSSPYVVYQRRNIVESTIEDNHGESTEHIPCYRYEEREMTRDEYEQMQAQLSSPATELIMQAMSDMELNLTMAVLGV